MPPKKGPPRIYKLPRLLDHSPDPVAVISDQFTVVYANQACCDWLGAPSDEVIGSSLAFAPASSNGDQRFNGICPSPQLFALQPHNTVNQINVTRGGKRIFRQATFNRIACEDTERSAVLVIANGDDFQEPAVDPAGDPAWHELYVKMRNADSAIFHAESLVGTSDQAVRIRRQVAAAAANQADCLVIGPAGSGREHVARTIFCERNLANAQLVPIHCSIADSELIQSAIKNWVFDRRNNNSSDWLLLLDVDRLSVDAQSELLGYTRLPDFQLPIIATAGQELMQMALHGDFSKSLAMHLSIQTIALSPLTERIQDLPLLVQAFIEQKNQAGSHQVGGASDEVLQTLAEYCWPRNVAELKQYVDAAHDHCQSAAIQLSDLPEEFSYALSAARIGHHQLPSIDLTEYLEQIERELIARALAQSGNNKTQAARLLGISRARLLRRLASLDIDNGRRDEDQLIDESEFKEAE